MRRSPAFDMPLFLGVLVLVGLGIVFVYTASYPKALAQVGGNSFYYAGRQIVFAVAGLAAMFICLRIPLAFMQRHYVAIIVIALAMLFLVLAVGPQLHGNRAWIRLGSLGTFQPSEFAKVAVILALSAYLAKRPWSLKSLRALLAGPYWFLLVPVGLICAQGDLGSAAVMGLSILVLLGVAGTQFRFWGLPLLGMLALALMVVLAGHRAARIQAWLHPFERSIEASFQPRNSLIAVGSGGVFGRGLCASRQKWHYLPGAHNDYIVAIVAEELGFIGTVLFLFAPYLFLVYRGFTIAHRAPDEFGAMVAAGCTIMLATQALINIAVVLNIIPCMGITLPFISYGGSSLIASMMMAGLLLNVSTLQTARETPRQSARSHTPRTAHA